MNERQEKILLAIVQEYSQTAIPIGSKALVKKYEIVASPATVRNDMAWLEEEGYLYQPHISAGRIPTDKGYRYFVERMSQPQGLTLREQKKLQKELLKLKSQNLRLTRSLAKLLAGFSDSMAISGILDQKEFADFGLKELLEEPEFQELDEVSRLAETLDYIDETFDKIIQELKEDETKIFIGQENPIDNIANCSMVISPYQLRSGEKGVLALIGTKRMQYDRNKSLIDYIKKIIHNLEK